MELERRRRLLYFFPVIFCFCLPFGSLLLSAIVVLWTVVSFFNIRKDEIRALLKRRIFWLFAMFFALTCVSALISDNRADGLFAIEVKLGLIIFPYLMFGFRYPPDLLRRCVVSFVSGCFFACLYLVIRASIFAFNGQPEYFFYTHFSQLLHVSYFSMYLILAIVFVTLFYRQWFSIDRGLIYSSWFFIAFFIAGIFLCSSKMGIISFLLCMPILAYYRHRLRFGKKCVFVGLAIAGFILWGVIVLFPGAFARFSSLREVDMSKLDKSSAESTQVRLLVWQQAWKLGTENWLTGVGAGDASDALCKSYEENGLTGALSHRLNAHNQYLQTLIALGLSGLLLLLVILLGEFTIAAVERHFLMVIFTLLLILNFLVESMMETAAGMLFMVFFYCFFTICGEGTLSGKKVSA